MKLNNCIYDYDSYIAIANGAQFGDNESNYISGKEAMQQASAANIKINGELIATCGYIFRWNRAGTALIPARVTMHPKTMVNLERGLRRYGHCHIANEGW